LVKRRRKPRPEIVLQVAAGTQPDACATLLTFTARAHETFVCVTSYLNHLDFKPSDES
jgi:hypothetical protein